MKSQFSFILLVALLGCTNGQYYNSGQSNSISSYIGKQTQTINKLMNALHSDLTDMPSNLKDENLIRDVGYELYNARSTLSSFVVYSAGVIGSLEPIYIARRLISDTQNFAISMISHTFKIATRLANSGKKIEDAFPKTFMVFNSADVQYLLNDLKPYNLYYSLKNILNQTIYNLRSGSYSLSNLLSDDFAKLLVDINGLIDKLPRYNLYR